MRLERMIHFVPPHMEKMRAKVPELARQVDVVLGNLEDAFRWTPRERPARASSKWGKSVDFGPTGLWTRINALNSPWALDDGLRLSVPSATSSNVIMLPKVDGPMGHPHYLDQLLAQLEAGTNCQADPDPRHSGKPRRASTMSRRSRPPRRACNGMSLGPPIWPLARHENDARWRAGHPEYKVLADAAGDGPRAAYQQDLWHYTVGRMVDACAAAGIKPFYGPFGDSRIRPHCESQFRNAFLMAAWAPGRCTRPRLP